MFCDCSECRGKISVEINYPIYDSILFELNQLKEAVEWVEKYIEKYRREI